MTSSPRRPRLSGRRLLAPLLSALLLLGWSAANAATTTPRFCAVPPKARFTPGPDQGWVAMLHDRLQDEGARMARQVDLFNARFGRTSQLRLQPRPISGKFKALVLAVEFSDISATTPIPTLRTTFFSTEPGARSMRSYFLENSYGKLDVDGEVVGDPASPTGFLRLSQTYGFYSGGSFGTGKYPNNAQRLVEDALVAAVRANPTIDLRQFDATGDGRVDFMVVVHAGRGAEHTVDPQTLWSHYAPLPESRIVRRNLPGTADAEFQIFRQGSLFTTLPQRGGAGIEFSISVADYVVVSESPEYSTLSHEMGHAMGLPDLYGRALSWEGVGQWSMMASGNVLDPPSHFDAWSKSKLGWLTPTEIRATTAGVQVPMASKNPVAIKIPADPNRPEEYFLLETRLNQEFDATTYDAALPGSGMLIYHVDDSLESNDNFRHPLLRVEEADGNYNLLMNPRTLPFPFSNAGDATDPWPVSPEKNTFGPDTRPSSHRYDGQSSGVTVVVGAPGPVMTADITIDQGGPGTATLSGVLVTEDGSPLPQLNLAVAPVGGDLLPNQPVMEGGSFTFADLPAGSYRLIVTSAGWVPLFKAVDLTRGDQRVELVLLRQPVFRPGWNLVSIPLDFAGSRAADVFGDASLRVYAYTNGQYELNPVLRPGMGVWLLETQEGLHQVVLPGQPLDTRAIGVAPLERGWSLVGNPFPLSVVWDTDRITHRSAQGVRTLVAARAAGLAQDIAWTYNSATGSYERLTDGGTLGTFQGAWYFSSLAGSLAFPPPPSPFPAPTAGIAEAGGAVLR